MLLNELYKRRKTLEEYLCICSKKLRNAPDGWLRTCTSKGRVSFYIKKKKNDYAGTYIPYHGNEKLIMQLASKEYYEKAREMIRKELKDIERLIKTEEKHVISAVYEKLNSTKKTLVVPLEDSLENEIKQWEKVKYPIMDSKPGSYVIKTKRGEFVRSKAEYNIANSLRDEGIPYKYEPVLMTVDGNYERPDFEIKSPVTGEVFYWEHFGMLDRPDYVDRMMTKLESYMLSDLYPGNGLIVTFDDGRHSLDLSNIRRIIRKYFKCA